MSLLETELYLDRAQIPSASAVVEHLRKHGYPVSFFEGFDLADESHAFWTPMTIHGLQTGFDYQIASRTELSGQEPSPSDPGYGDTYLAFVARNHTGSVLAAALTQLAICELADAKGGVRPAETSFENGAMIDFLRATIADAERTISKDSDPAVHFLPAQAPRTKSRLPENYFRNIGMAALLGIVVFGVIIGLPYLIGSFVSP